MRIVITGSSGFIGTRLVPRLKQAGHDVVSIDIRDGIDITNWDQIQGIASFDLLIHLAALTFVPDSYLNPRKMYLLNVLGTLNMLQLCHKNKAKMIFTSSYVYGVPKYMPIDEEHPIVAFNPYSQSKLIGEQLCSAYNRDFGIPIIIFRPFNLYGLGQNENFLISLIIKQLKEKREVLLKDPRPKRDFIHVDDVVNAYCKAVDYNKSTFEIFNLGFGKSYSVRQVAEMLAENYSDKLHIKFSGESRQNEVLDTIADIKKAKQLLEWKPTITLEDGISNMK